MIQVAGLFCVGSSGLDFQQQQSNLTSDGVSICNRVTICNDQCLRRSVAVMVSAGFAVVRQVSNMNPIMPTLFIVAIYGVAPKGL